MLLNRRGWSPFLSCRSCGRAWSCPHCDVSLVLHKLHRSASLRCHHCGHGEPVPESCPDCGSVALARHGVGTERLATLLGEAVAPLPVFRLDSDSAAAAGDPSRDPAAFRPGGVRRPGGHPDGRQGARLPGRGAERRAGRRRHPPLSRLPGRGADLRAGLPARRTQRPRRARGRVLVQTLAPDAPAIRHAAAHDAAGFLAGELERRRALRYPPFSHLVRIELRRTRQGAPSGPRSDSRQPWTGDFRRAPSCWARRLAFGFGVATAASSCSRPAIGPARWPRCAGPSRGSRLEGLRGVALSVDVDPQ